MLEFKKKQKTPWTQKMQQKWKKKNRNKKRIVCSTFYISLLQLTSGSGKNTKKKTQKGGITKMWHKRCFFNTFL